MKPHYNQNSVDVELLRYGHHFCLYVCMSSSSLTLRKAVSSPSCGHSKLYLPLLPTPCGFPPPSRSERACCRSGRRELFSSSARRLDSSCRSNLFLIADPSRTGHLGPDCNRTVVHKWFDLRLATSLSEVVLRCFYISSPIASLNLFGNMSAFSPAEQFEMLVV